MSNTELILAYLLTINLYAELEREAGTLKPYLLSLEDLSSELAALIISRGLGAQAGRYDLNYGLTRKDGRALDPFEAFADELFKDEE